MFWKNDIVIQLKRIADALEAANDFSKEDAIVVKATKDIQQHLPSEPTKKGTQNASIKRTV